MRLAETSTTASLPEWMPSRKDCGPTAREELIALLNTLDITKEEALQVMYYVEKTIDDC